MRRNRVLIAVSALLIGLVAPVFAEEPAGSGAAASQKAPATKKPKPGGAASTSTTAVTNSAANNECTASGPDRVVVAINNSAQLPSKTEAKQQESAWEWFGHAFLALLRVISWPVVFLIIVLYFTLSKLAPYKLARVLKPFRSLKLFGTEFELSGEVGADAEQAIEIYQRQARRQFDTLVDAYDIRSKLEAVVVTAQSLIDVRQPKGLRSTVHVPDVFFADSLYQLLDYYPRGGGRGRTFPSRKGVLGLCWRLRSDEIQGSVETDPKALIRGWGMTKEEAAASGQGRQSFAAVLLCDDSGSAVGVFYMDAEPKDVFGTGAGDAFSSKLIEVVKTAARDKGLVASLTKMNDALKDKRPAIRIYAQ